MEGYLDRPTTHNYIHPDGGTAHRDSPSRHGDEHLASYVHSHTNIGPDDADADAHSGTDAHTYSLPP